VYFSFFSSTVRPPNGKRSGRDCRRILPERAHLHRIRTDIRRGQEQRRGSGLGRKGVCWSVLTLVPRRTRSRRGRHLIDRAVEARARQPGRLLAGLSGETGVGPAAVRWVVTNNRHYGRGRSECDGKLEADENRTWKPDLPPTRTVLAGELP
jgi:hypothetical protein